MGLWGVRESLVRGLGIAVCAAMAFSGCASQSDSSSCAAGPTQQVAGSSGTAEVFIPDPRMASQDPSLSPHDDLDPYRTQVTLDHLTGKGVLQGQYVDVRTNAGTCAGGYGATSSSNDFSYSQKNPHFQEAMAYYWGDRYQTALQNAGVDLPDHPVQIVAHCMKQDNAYFEPLYLPNGSWVGRVCLGDSQITPGASYADDAYVTIHELQHAMTARHYSDTEMMDRFPYDEAGAVNEGISDFMAMMFLSPEVPSDGNFDSAVFSEWALGNFQGFPNFRGAHRCPTYDPTYPLCQNFPAFKAQEGTISYVYPDGLGWPFAGPPNADEAFDFFGMPEEIHNNAIIIEGALWDIYQDLQNSHDDAQPLMMKLVADTLEDLPKPNSMNLSPVTFPEFAHSLIHVARAMGFSPQDLAAISSPLEQRGLLHAPELEEQWAKQGKGLPSTPGMSVIDSAPTMKDWLRRFGEDSSFIVAKTGPADGTLSPGETAVIWFDLKDTSPFSAGGVLLTITSKDPNVTFIQQSNPGWISSDKVQIEYSKINGLSVVSNLVNQSPHISLQTSDSYFQTDPHYQFAMGSGVNLMTGIWVQVSPNAKPNEAVAFEVKAKPANGDSSTVTFDEKLK